MSPKVDSVSSLRLKSSRSLSAGHSCALRRDAGQVGLEKLVSFLVDASEYQRPLCPCNLLENCSEETPWVSSGAKMIVEHTPLLLPYLWRAAMSQKPDKLRPHPSSEGMASMEGGEGYVSISVAWFVVGSEKHSSGSATPSPHQLQAHVQIQIIDLFMALSRH